MALSAVQAKPLQDITAQKISEPTNLHAQSGGHDVMGRQIQARYSETPGVIPVGSNSGLNRRIARLTVDPVPLLHRLQQRWLADADPSAVVGVEMPYMHRPAGRAADAGLGETEPVYSTADPVALPAAADAQLVAQAGSTANATVARQSLPQVVTPASTNPGPERLENHTDWGAGILRRHLAGTTSHIEPTVSVDPVKGSLPRRLVARALVSNASPAGQRDAHGQFPPVFSPLPLEISDARPMAEAKRPRSVVAVGQTDPLPSATSLLPDQQESNPAMSTPATIDASLAPGAGSSTLASAPLASTMQTKPLSLPQAATLSGSNLATAPTERGESGAPIIQPDKPVGEHPVAHSVYLQRTQDPALSNMPVSTLTSAPPQRPMPTPVVRRAQPAVGTRDEPVASANATAHATAWRASVSLTGQGATVIGTPIVQRRRGGADSVRSKEAGQGLPTPPEQPLVGATAQQRLPVRTPNQPPPPVNPIAQAASSTTLPTETPLDRDAQAANVSELNRPVLAPQTVLASQLTPISLQGAASIPQTGEQRIRLVQRRLPSDTPQTIPAAAATATPLQALPLEPSSFVQQSSARGTVVNHHSLRRSAASTPEGARMNSFLAREPMQKNAVAADSFVMQPSERDTPAGGDLRRSAQTQSEVVTSSPMQPSADAITPGLELVQRASVRQVTNTAVQPVAPLTPPEESMGQQAAALAENSPSGASAQTAAHLNEQEHRLPGIGNTSGAVVPAPSYLNLALERAAGQQAPLVTVATQSSATTSMLPVRRLSTNMGQSEPRKAVLPPSVFRATSQRTQAATEIRPPSLASLSTGHNVQRREGVEPIASEIIQRTGEEEPHFPLIQRTLPVKEQSTVQGMRTVQVAQAQPELHALPVIPSRTAPLGTRFSGQPLPVNEGEGARVLPLVNALQPKTAAPEEKPWRSDPLMDALGATFVQHLSGGPTGPLLQRLFLPDSGKTERSDAGAPPLTWFAPAGLLQRALAATLSGRTFESASRGGSQGQEWVQAPTVQRSPTPSSTPAAPTAEQSSLTAALANMTTPIAPATGAARQSLDNIDFERLADRVYAIIEQRLIKERESLGL